MSGEMDLNALIATMNPALSPETFVFTTTSAPTPEALEAAVMTFREDEGLTLILPRGAAEAAGLSHAFPCRMITLKVHSALEAVGFIAAVAARLAQIGMGANAVAAYHHDHIFVPEDRAEEALAALRALASGGLSPRAPGR